MRPDIREALNGRLLWRQSFQTSRGIYTISIVKSRGEYYVIKRNNGVVVEARAIRRDMDEGRRPLEDPDAVEE